jgi:hypothetical protein
MKILTKDEEAEHYAAVVKGGSIGGVAGLVLGTAGVLFASRRYPAFKHLTVPFRVFLPVSIGTFASIIGADRASANFDLHHNKQRLALSQHVSDYDRYERQKPLSERARDWAAENRYPIVVAAWAASMGVAFALVRKNPYLTASQKIVQSRVYAQGLTIAVLLGSFAFEANDATKQRGRWETVKVLDPTDPLHQRLIEKKIHHERYEGEDQWMEVIEAEEQRMKERKASHEAEMRTIREAEAKSASKRESLPEVD